ncbi:hypothetical protein CC86DRAFT_177629 [Ophiobolus disseminans]|uniref:Uncharacterized protein n=1 Tax=Ophiobolus disseminans TaxID=1469910 RepID=A0A6A7A9F1_9PLEO|nr:hypothetical protein CC86DRAFT_177629 [Ophiobolus disseminans]
MSRLDICTRHGKEHQVAPARTGHAAWTSRIGLHMGSSRSPNWQPRPAPGLDIIRRAFDGLCHANASTELRAAYTDASCTSAACMRWSRDPLVSPTLACIELGNLGRMCADHLSRKRPGVALLLQISSLLLLINRCLRKLERCRHGTPTTCPTLASVVETARIVPKQTWKTCFGSSRDTCIHAW